MKPGVHPMYRMFALLACLLPCFLHAGELTVQRGGRTTTYASAALLARDDVRVIHVPADVSYHRDMTYRALPLRDLLDGMQAGDHLQFVASDGFTAEIAATLLLDTHGAQAWLAIEPAGQPWPALDAGKPSAGPFYVVWTNPAQSHISPEQWPYRLTTIRLTDAPAQRFPAMLPAAEVPAGSPIRHGFALFQQHCMACHTLNGQGDARLGPDLNIPHNPTEYLRADLLRGLIRNPQSLRRWPQAKMPGFDTYVLSDADLDDLLAYLGHMSEHKATP
jgi:mono/diheme cytochrome c family protein